MHVTLVQKCRLSPGVCQCCQTKIKKGDPYRWWKFRYGGRRVRCMAAKCAPKGSELISNPFQSALMAISEGIDKAIGEARSAVDPEVAIDAIRSAAEELRSLGEEQNEKMTNMPENFQQGETYDLLENRASECEDKAGELESAADTAESEWENRSDEDSEPASESVGGGVGGKGEQEICDSILDELDSSANDITID